jgi:hypothetical protein
MGDASLAPPDTSHDGINRRTSMTRSFSLMHQVGLCRAVGGAPALFGLRAINPMPSAIAVARSKIAAGDKVGTGRRAWCRNRPAPPCCRRRTWNNHHKKEARVAAISAGELADRALISGDNRRAQAEQTRRLDTQEATINAQQSAASANQRTNSAEAMGNASRRCRQCSRRRRPCARLAVQPTAAMARLAADHHHRHPAGNPRRSGDHAAARRPADPPAPPRPAMRRHHHHKTTTKVVTTSQR